ncbi:hypothetical protein FGB62_43g010 [Gracilaria domingensis]|nr:hypothetical protein FGB62_43g010 [Gracilaria domingensis]
MLFWTRNTDMMTAKAAATLAGALKDLNNALSSCAVDHALTSAINVIGNSCMANSNSESSTDHARSAVVITAPADAGKFPYIVFRYQDNLLGQLWHNVWDRELSVREQGLQAIQAVLKNVLKNRRKIACRGSDERRN